MRLDEYLARCLAARKLKRLKDPRGSTLPEEVWRKHLADAQFVLGAIQAFDMREVVIRYHGLGDCSD
jgi:hypothetical protein